MGTSFQVKSIGNGVGRSKVLREIQPISMLFVNCCSKGQDSWNGKQNLLSKVSWWVDGLLLSRDWEVSLLKQQRHIDELLWDYVCITRKRCWISKLISCINEILSVTFIWYNNLITHNFVSMGKRVIIQPLAFIFLPYYRILNKCWSTLIIG